MSDPSQVDTTENRKPSDKTIAYVVYVLYLVGFLAGGPAVLVGVIIAYLARKRTRDSLLEAHYSWQIRIFWWSLAAIAIVMTVALFLIASLVFWVFGVVLAVLFGVILAITVVVLACRGMLDLSNDKSPSKRYVV